MNPSITTPDSIRSLSAPENLDAYQIGARGERGQAAFVMLPDSTEQVAECVRWCQQHAITYKVQSGNTGLVGASTPDNSGTQAVLSLEKLNNTFALSLDNRSVTASSGIRLWDLNQRLEPHQLFLPIDLSSDPMLGGMVATNTGGTRLLRYGDMRSQVLGMTVILPNGDIMKLGSGLRKDNTGMDWKQLFIGTAGHYGIITEVTLNLEPRPQQQAAVLLIPTSHEAVFTLLRFFEQRLDTLFSAYEYLSGNAVKYALQHSPSLRNPFVNEIIPELTLLLEVSRTNAPARWDTPLQEVLEQILTEAWELPDAPLQDALFGRFETIWQLRHSISEGVKAAGKLFAFDLAFERPTALAFRQAMLDELPQHFPQLEICDFGHIGDGGLHFNLVCHDHVLATDPTFERRLRDWVIEQAVERFGGSYSAEHGIGPTNQRYFERYHAPLAQQLTQVLCKP